MNLIRLGKVVMVTVLMLTLTFANAASMLAFSITNSATASYFAEVNLGDKLKGSVEKASGKVQETVGNITGDRETQIEGKVKQAEGGIRSVPSDFGGNKTDRLTQAEIEGKTQQAESNIRRYQARD